jgi:hypothetical protein
MSYQALPGFVNDPFGSVTPVCILKFYTKINHFFGRICCNGKNKIKNKQSSIHDVEIVKMNDEKLYMFLMMSWKSAASYHMLPKKSKLRYQKQFEKFTRE